MYNSGHEWSTEFSLWLFVARAVIVKWLSNTAISNLTVIGQLDSHCSCLWL